MKYFIELEDKELPEFCDTIVSVNMSAEIFSWKSDIFYQRLAELEKITMNRLKELNPKYHDEILELKKQSLNKLKR